MIVARLFGGLGNQLFIYAYAFSLAKRLNQELLLDATSGFSRDFIFCRENNLKYFNIQTRRPKPIYIHDGVIGRIFRKIFRKFDFPLRLFKVYYITDKNIDISLLKLQYSKYIYLEGYFNSHQLFKDYRVEIRESLMMTMPHSYLSEKVRFIFDDKSSQKICIHYRSYKDVPIKNRSQNLIINERYYLEAISFFQEKFNKVQFIVFSDDIPQAKIILKNDDIKFIDNIHFIENNNSDIPAQIKDFILMTQCDHYIIANSTFSWWGAFLSNNDSKIVLRPSYEFYSQNNHFYPDDWIQI